MKLWDRSLTVLLMVVEHFYDLVITNRLSLIGSWNSVAGGRDCRGLALPANASRVDTSAGTMRARVLTRALALQTHGVGKPLGRCFLCRILTAPSASNRFQSRPRRLLGKCCYRW